MEFGVWKTRNLFSLVETEMKRERTGQRQMSSLETAMGCFLVATIAGDKLETVVTGNFSASNRILI